MVSKLKYNEFLIKLDPLKEKFEIRKEREAL